MEKFQKPIVLSIAGFDPSAGAGILADIKTFEMTGTYGLGVISVYTLQTEKEFYKISGRRNIKNIIEEIITLTDYYPVSFAKIGMIKEYEALQDIVYTLYNKKVKIIFDPILKTSTSKVTFTKSNILQIKNILDKIYCITPNLDEALSISNKDNITEAGLYLSNFTNVIIKGGHNKEKTGTDFLFIHKSNQSIEIPPQTNAEIYPKHGSGCVFSSALTSYLAQGFTLEESAKSAKTYTEKFLNSNKSLLGYHHKL